MHVLMCAYVPVRRTHVCMRAYVHEYPCIETCVHAYMNAFVHECLCIGHMCELVILLEAIYAFP